MPGKSDKKGISKLLKKAGQAFKRTEEQLSDDPAVDTKKSSSAKRQPKSFSPEKRTQKETSRKLEFGTGRRSDAVRAKGTRHNVLSFVLMLAALLTAVLLNGTCYVPFKPAHDIICPLVNRVKVTTGPVVDGVVSTVSTVSHTVVELVEIEDIVAKFEGQVARLQDSYPWMWRRKSSGGSALVAMLGVENKVAASLVDGLVVAGEIGLGSSVALWVVSRALKLDLSSLAPFSRGGR